MTDPATEKPHFGFKTVATGEKAGRVRGVFDSVAPNYDLMNDLMSGGLHRLWKRFTLNHTGLHVGDRALDVAGGTGDLTAGLSRQVGRSGMVLLTDINASMLDLGRRRLVDKGIVKNVALVQANAEHLPVSDASFHCITIGFGLRNITDKKAALESMAKALKPGGRLLILEFSRPALKFIEPLYDFYSFKILPALGEVFAGDAPSYQYLAESIRMHPEQDALLNMMDRAGLENCHYYNLAAGIVALHIGYRY